MAQEPPLQLKLTAGVELRLLEPGQEDAIFSTVQAHRAYLREWLPWVDTTQAPSDTRAFLEHHAAQRAQGLSFAYSLWEGERLIGTIGTHDITPNRKAAIGYWLVENCQHRGLITAAVRQMLRLCFETYELERVEIHCAAGNTRSSAIPERLGFTFEGILRHAQLLHGRFIDMRLYSLLREEYYSEIASSASCNSPSA